MEKGRAENALALRPCHSCWGRRAAKPTDSALVLNGDDHQWFDDFLKGHDVPWVDERECSLLLAGVFVEVYDLDRFGGNRAG